MKNKKSFIIPIIALALAACTPKPNISSIGPSISGSILPSSETTSSENKPSSDMVSSSENVSSQPLLSSKYESSSFSSSNEELSSSEQESSSEIISSSEEQSSSTVSSSSELPSSSSEAPSSSSSSSSSTPLEDVFVDLELYAVNDFHGNVRDNSKGLGISKTSTLFDYHPYNAHNALYISQGDMWQGSLESNNTKGKLVTEWMNQVGFTSMTVGNHEFDWGTSYIQTNSQLADFPFLGINVYSVATNQRVSYLDPSVVIEKNGAKIGIIGAIGDCYDSIASSKVQDVYFVTGSSLTNLVQQEANRLRNQEGCDFIIYSVHDGMNEYGNSNYDINISNYVDLVLEGHTHRYYMEVDSKGIYHIQGSSNNKNFSYINLTINTTRNTFVINETKTVWTTNYDYLDDDAEAESLFTKYADEIGSHTGVVGYNSAYRSDDEVEDLVADLYLQYGMEKWGSSYNVFLGGGYLKTREPYVLEEGDVTYETLANLFPFDNDVQLCSITGYYLYYKFINSTNTDYHISYSSFGDSYRSNVDFNTVYYVIVDNYTSDYSSNHLTVIDTLTDDPLNAKDMLAQYILEGGLE